VVARREGEATAQADATRVNAERALGDDVDMVGLDLPHALRDAAAGRERQTNVGVGGQGEGAVAGRREMHHLNVHRRKGREEAFQRLDDAIDLRLPGIGDEEDSFHLEIPGVIRVLAMAPVIPEIDSPANGFAIVVGHHHEFPMTRAAGRSIPIP
jgi:hypothetical protein